ncbi:DUF2771 family protein [Rhodococcus sp. P1Y]|uniref:DUF2771 family protein n=1 Tax=Rhodococcus sp. P1Y TaxID=1302308 RepID=UPI000EAFD8BA|nr:DUF2771 family protein [Rhodococcus sp. P1Y]AYJ48584.1 DUF2771 domain-containing protein [Rhodococcus sp. P1Y]
MNLAPKTKKILAIGTAGLVVLAVAFVAVLAVLIQNAPTHRPTITAFADGRSVTVEPYLYCPVDAPLCENDGTSSSVPVRKGYPLQLSLPTEITSAPWIVAAVYSNDGGDAVETDTLYLPDEKLGLTVEPVDAEGRALLGVEIRLPSGVIDAGTQQEEIISHAIWSIATSQRQGS